MIIQPVRGGFAEAARQREHARNYDKKRQLRIKSGQREGRSSNWSQGGFLSSGLDDYHANDHVEGTMQGPDGRPVAFAGRVVRVHEDGMRAVQLVGLDSATLLAMQGVDDDDPSPLPSASKEAGSSANSGSNGRNSTMQSVADGYQSPLPSASNRARSSANKV
ncbi:MAG: PilZ domain-containing protein [Proteobacteria bacterium]|nr:PilZ domain-containing protein [Pseudomonadota bacterium]MDA1354916.1 PilZ domain-containing protein [Pseudomonadota bacterium]